MFVEGRVLTPDGQPIPGAVINTWETDGHGQYVVYSHQLINLACRYLGQYDVQYEHPAPDCRARLCTNEDGRYAFRAVVPIPYGIPNDVSVHFQLTCTPTHVSLVQGPVGDLLLHLGRHHMRPAHIHFMIEAPGFQKLITALYLNGDPYLESDSVFGVKKSLIVVRSVLLESNASRSCPLCRAEAEPGEGRN